MDGHSDGRFAEGWQFEQFVGEVLSRAYEIPATQLERDQAADLGVDFQAMQGGQPIFVEVKAQTPQTTRRLHDTIAQLKAAAARYRQANPRSPDPRLIIAFPGVLSPRKEVPSDVEVWDGRYLQREARRFGIAPPAFLASAEGEERAEEREPAEDLMRRLSLISHGTSDWTRYEKFCEDLLRFLFCPPLQQVIPQSRNETGVNRRDFILPNYAPDGFWHFMRVNYHADFVVAEAKNLAGPARKAEVLQLANYLTRHGTGLVGMLMTRHGFANDARWTSREQWLLHDKLIVGFDDEDYRQMLTSKRAGGDPSDLVRQRIEDFRLRI
jgi:hypothetical protein